MIPPNDDELQPIESSMDDRRYDQAGFDDQAFDVLIEEAVGGRAPVDVTESVLRALQERPQSPSLAMTGRSRGSRDHLRRKNSSRLRYAALAVAACGMIVLGFWANREKKPANGGQAIASSSETFRDPSTSIPIAPRETNTVDQITKTDQAKRPRALPKPIEFATDTDESFPDAMKIQSDPTVTPTPPLRPLTSVSKQLGQSVETYWRSIDVQPTMEADADAWRDRWAQAIGVSRESTRTVYPEQLEDVVRWISQPETASKFADQWLKTIFGKSLTDVSLEARATMRSQISDSITGKNKLSNVVQDWMADPEHPFIATDGQIVGDQKVCVKRVATLALAADLRCSGCHDGLVDRRISQADHWSIASVIANTGKDVFYETIDGRRRLAEKKMPAAFSNVSRSLAAGTIQTLWATAFKRPPSGSVVDDPALQSLRTTLIDDLLSSEFNLSRTIALMITSPAGRRTVPEIYQDGSWATSDRSTAERQIDAFAAAPPIAPPSDIGQRTAFNLQSIGRKLDRSEDRSLLAQIEVQTTKESSAVFDSARSKSLPFSWDYPDRLTVMPATWLETIDDESQRMRHIAYLDGYSELPTEVTDAAAEMKKANLSESLRLSRIWWLMQ
jgi:hypothetical protein